MIHDTSGLTESQVQDLVEVFTEHLPWDPRRTLAPALAVELALEAWRTNVPQVVPAKHYRIDQSTVSRTVRLVTRVLAARLERIDPPVTEIPDTALIVDATFIPTGNRRDVAKSRSGHKRRHGMTIQVVCYLNGRMLTTSDPVPAGWQDITAFHTWHLAEQLDHPQTLADKAYQGTHMTVPHKKPRKADFPDPDMGVFNTQLSRIRAAVERCIAHLKNWRVLATGYRGRITELPTLIALITRLERLRTT